MLEFKSADHHSSTKGKVRVFPTEYDLLPKMLKPAGYTTLMAGILYI